MKVLISAKACNPYLGSENYFGWAAVKCLAQDHELWVITGTRNQPDLERARNDGMVPSNVHFVFAGNDKKWRQNRLLAKMQDWKAYIRFAKDSLRVAQDLHRIEKFDLLHHVTFTTSRVPLPISQLDIPFVFGPICGNEEFPLRLFPLLSTAGAAFELSRKISNGVARYSPSVRRCIRRADHVFAITEEAEELVSAIRGSKAGISSLSPGFFSTTRVAEFTRYASNKDVSGMLRLYAAGNLGGQKCIALALEALSRVKKRGIDFRYHLGASGPEIPHLKKLAVRLGLTEQIIFGGTMSREDYQRELGNTHVYLLPSMRETVGLTMMEAMMAGCVPVVADSGGPRVAVTDDCGYKIPVSTSHEMADQIADVISVINRDRKIIQEKGTKASARIVANYTEENYRRTVNAVYASVRRK